MTIQELKNKLNDNQRTVARIAFEAGYKAREHNENIQQAIEEFEKLMKECGL